MIFEINFEPFFTFFLKKISFLRCFDNLLNEKIKFGYHSRNFLKTIT